MRGSLRITRRRGGQVLSFVTGLIASVGATANPQVAQVAHGAARFTMPNPQTLEITNSPAAVINWQSFDIARGETTRFIQQNAASSVLNRVTSGNSSEILGSLVSNGRVFLINPAGILIGREGSIDAAGVWLSTLQISDQDFLNGRLHFDREAGDGGITNHGYIKTAPGGEVVLLAPRIENSPEKGNAKSGIIESPNGDLLLAAGTSITIASLDDPDITFDVKAPDNEVVNLGRLLARGGTASILAGTIRHSGEINADSVGRDAEGRIVLKASNRIALDAGSRIHASGGSRADGGTVEISALSRGSDGGNIDALGSIRADGVHGGKVVVRADGLLVDGLVSTQGVKGGGTIDIKTRDATIATVDAKLQAASTDGNGGRIYVDGGKSAFSSASIRATGEKGGSVRILGDEVTLAAGTVRASGEHGGGKIRVGGGFRGGENLRAADKVQISDATTIKADAVAAGDGGDVAVWSAGTTRFAGSISARGGAASGDGGRVEVSGRDGLGFTGNVLVSAANGENGTLLLDPKNLRFTSEELPAAPTRLLDPHPGADNFFGGGLDFFNASGARTSSSNGAATVVVYDPSDDFGGANAGAVYVYRLSDGALLSALHGNAVGDQVGSNFVDNFSFSGVNLLKSTQWGGGAGALTLFDPVKGTSGAVTASNSLVGASSGDGIGNSILRVLGNNSVAVLSPNFDGNRGAITVVSRSTVRGEVSSSISLVGANAGDQLGLNSKFDDLGGGHFAARSVNGGFGSLTLFHAGTRITGMVDATTSLVGSTSTDAVADDLFQLGNSKFWVATSSQWNGGIGAVTWIDRTGNIRDTVNSGNSLLGTAVGDLGASARFRSLGGANYLLFSENGGAGAVTFINPTSLPTNVVDASNSLVGSLPTDKIGHTTGGATANFERFGSKFAIYSPQWNSDSGAVTWGDVTTGFAPDSVSALNSLVGAAPGDLVGDSGIVDVGFGRGLLHSLNSGAGAVTLIDLTAPLPGPVDSGNSLVGAVSTDAVGGDGIEQIDFSATYAIKSSNWAGMAGDLKFGAVTFFDASTGTISGTATPFAGLVSSSNSLVGSNTNDQVGSGGVEFAYSGSADSFYAVLSPNWDNTPSVSNAGAISWFTLSGGLSGTVSTINSMLGSSLNDRVGLGSTFVSGLRNSPTGVYQLLGSSSQSAVYYNPNHNSGAGAVVFLPGSGPVKDFITSSNALLGSTADDAIGSNGIYERGGKYIVLSPDWDNVTISNAGAVTVVDASNGLTINGLTGPVTSGNSLVGDNVNDRVGGGDLEVLNNNNLLIVSDQWNGNAGAVTFLDTASGHFGGSANGVLFGVLDETNSLVGRRANDAVGSEGFETSEAGTGYYVVFSPLVDSTAGITDVGAVTIGDQVQGVRGFADDNTISFVGTLADDELGANGNTDSTTNGNIFLLNPQWHGNMGAATFVDLVNGTGLSGDISSGNSVVGQVAGDLVGVGGVRMLTGDSLVIRSQNWSNNGTATDAGALTWGNQLTGVSGMVDDTNSLFGATADDGIGRNNNDVFTRSFGAITRVVVRSPDWDNGATVDAGAITTFLPSAPATGAVNSSTAPSLVGDNADDAIGSGFEQFLNNGNLLIVHDDWNNGRGAVTFWNGSSNLQGVVGPGNSLVGANAGDNVGEFGVNQVSGTNVYMVRTPSFNNNAGALTFGSVTAGVKGVVRPATSLVGATSGDRVGVSFPDNFFNGTGHMLLASTHGGRGAVTYIDAADPPTGVISAVNSLVGNRAGDAVGSERRFVTQGVQAIFSPDWDNGAVADAGAITMIDMNTGNFLGTTTSFAGRINANNSLVGTFAGDRVGGFAVNSFGSVIATYGQNNELGAIFSPNWNEARGAITWFTPGERIVGEITPTNSLVGSSAGDLVGAGFSNQIDFFNSGSFIPPGTTSPAFAAVFSPNWHGTRGAITWFKPGERPVGRISAKNSLVGGFVGDFAGSEQNEDFNHSMMRLTSGNHLLFTSRFNNNAGAVTYLNAARGLPVGAISNGNSFVGAPGDRIGSGSAFALDGERVLISSSQATVDGLGNAGRLDLFDGSKTQAVDGIGFGSSAADDLAISIPAVVKFLNDGGALTLQASNDIFIPQGTNIIAKGGRLTLEAGRSIDIKGNILTDGFLRLFANAPGGDASQREPGEGFVTILADSQPTLVRANELEVEAQNVVVKGGSSNGAYAALVGVESAKILAHGSGLVSLSAGTGNDIAPTSSFDILGKLIPRDEDRTSVPQLDTPFAVILGVKSLDVNSEFIEMNGGGSGGAFASIASFGDLTVASIDIKMQVGSAANTDAAFLALGGAAEITSTTCTGCGELLSDPLLDATSQTGTFVSGLLQNPTIDSVLAMLGQGENVDKAEEDKDDGDTVGEAECH